MLIHATNITGVGASHVVTSFLDAAADTKLLDDAIIYLPFEGPLSKYNPNSGRVIRYKRYLNNNISRLLECLFSRFIFPQSDRILVLGDIPLRGLKNQVVLVHQPNLISPEINSISSKSILYKVFRFIFKINLKYVKKIIVQTGAMAEGIGRSYSRVEHKIVVIPQPSPNWFDNSKRKIHGFNKTSDKVILFYPAAGYPHKNHSFLFKIEEAMKDKDIRFLDFEIWLTLTPIEFEPFKQIQFLKNLGRLSPKEVLYYYNNADAMIFLSLIESYGLPLIEALEINLPIICVDQPYSRWVCEDSVFYFKHDSVESFFNALNRMYTNLKNGIYPNNISVLSKFPKSWTSVVSDYMDLV